MFMENYSYIDVHSHAHDKAYDEDRPLVIARLEKSKGVTITVGTDYEESLKAVSLAEENPLVFASVGMHPVDNRSEEFVPERYKDLAVRPKVVAIGECGLDYFRLQADKEAGYIVDIDAEKERQKKLFQAQIGLATEVGKPLMLHGRPSKGSMDAYDDMIDMLKPAKHASGGALTGNFHFFVGDIRILEKVQNLGFTVSYSGVITFAKEYEDVVRQTPLEMMHAETDSPYVAPQRERGKRNEPVYVQEIIAKIAEIKGKSVEEVTSALNENARRMFRLTGL